MTATAQPAEVDVEYTCPEHGVIRRRVNLDANGKPPATFHCDVHLCGEPCGFDMCCCDQKSPLVAASPTTDRARPCTRRTWCTLAEHGDDTPCHEVPRAAQPPSDFGPRAAVGMRRGKQ